MQICWLMLKCKHALINYSWIIQKRRERSRKSRYATTKTKRHCAAFCNFKFIKKQFKRSPHSWNVFQDSKRNFVFLCGHVISSIYSLSKLKTKLEVISRYHEVVRSHFMKLPKQAEKSRTCAPNLVPKLVHKFIAIFHILNYLGSQ